MSDFQYNCRNTIIGLIIVLANVHNEPFNRSDDQIGNTIIYPPEGWRDLSKC
ncbi:uncharacterized protein METZ01_LOCUS305265 [marine metagenome]|uniref:Uncharacterized protein n=1 Tax=marine metagenome TaxID=408172 RepID=A0A382MYL4_9ZZZZ